MARPSIGQNPWGAALIADLNGIEATAAAAAADVAALDASLPTTIDDAVAAAVEAHTPGIELGAASRTSNFTTTNTSATNSGGDIPGLSVTVVGKGRPVDVRFHCPGAFHSVANTGVSVVTIRDGNPTGADNQIGSVLSALTTTGPSLTIVRRTSVLVAGTSYTFTARAWAAAAGTLTLVGAAYCPIELTVTAR